MLKLPKGELHKISSGFLSYEFFEAKEDLIYDIGASLINYFGFKEQFTPAVGLD